MLWSLLVLKCTADKELALAPVSVGMVLAVGFQLATSRKFATVGRHIMALFILTH